MFDWIASELAMMVTYYHTGIDLHEPVTGLWEFMYVFRMYDQYYDFYMNFLPVAAVLLAICVVLIVIQIVVPKRVKNEQETKVEELAEA